MKLRPAKERPATPNSSVLLNTTNRPVLARCNHPKRRLVDQMSARSLYWMSDCTNSRGVNEYDTRRRPRFATKLPHGRSMLLICQLRSIVSVSPANAQRRVERHPIPAKEPTH